ncbi:uncharacterized protein LOC111641052 [Centruroides sculpturatus]|uniref:uncharacterized protein LOC111641052 n=1 Tax=Centruroides sculpturatus TaxID=218467 RepID=UPI000C6DDC5D|nr:uncharacterized protein LOC111641052 [Centruroides sculpturatus]
MVPIHINIRSVVRLWNLLNKAPINNETDHSCDINVSDENCLEEPEMKAQIVKHGIDRSTNRWDTLHHPAEHSSIKIELRDNTDHPAYDWHIYTDGASNGDGTGAALVIYHNHDKVVVHEEYYKLGELCTNNQVELWGLDRALNYVIKNIKCMKGSIKFITDSRYALRSVNDRKHQTDTGTNIQQMARHLSKMRLVSFGWVPGHAGIQGNETADALAKRAAKSNINISFSRLPLNYIHKQLNSIIIKEWTNSSTGRTTFNFLPSIKARQGMNYLSPSYHLTQVLTGHGNIPSYLHRIKKRNDDHCDCDGSTTGDISHILTDCPNHDTPRNALINYCITNGTTWPPPWEFFCATKEAYSQLDKFAKDCGIFAVNSAT